MTESSLQERFFQMQNLLGRPYIFQNFDEMTRSQLVVIFSVIKCEENKDKPATVSYLANKMNVSNPAMSRMVHDLVELGWLQRNRNPEDRRTQIITATPLGYEKYQEAKKKVDAFMAQAFEDFTHDELETFIETGTDLALKMRDISQAYARQQEANKTNQKEMNQ